MLPKVIIIILNWNGREDTVECLDSLRKIDYQNCETILVDNGSTDGSVHYFKNMYPEVEIIENKENLGFAEGNNIGIKRAINKGMDYALLLNNDTIVDEHFLSELVHVAEEFSEVGILGPKIYFYKSTRIQSLGGKISLFRGVVSGQSKYKSDSAKYCNIKRTDFLTGCAMLIKKDVLKDVGLFDSSYFAYYEDTDLCIRTTKVGYGLVCVPTAVIWHKGSQSSKVNRFGLYYGTRNMIWFEKKYANIYQFGIFIIYFFSIKLPFLIAISIFYHKSFLSLRRCIEGTIDGFFGNR